MSWRSWAVAVLLSIVFVSPPALPAGAPNSPALSTVPIGSNDLFISVSGSGFGAPAPSHSIDVKRWINGTPGPTVNILSTDSRVRVWNEGQIVVRVDAAGVTRAEATVRVPGVSLFTVPVDLYGQQFFDTTHAVCCGPSNLTSDPTRQGFNAGRVYPNFEFHSSLAYFNPDAAPEAVEPLPNYPVPPFAMFRNPFAPVATTLSICGDAVTVDNEGRVYFNECGADAVQRDGVENHSRIVRFEGNTDTWSVYNIPGDQNQVFGVGWDKARKRIWLVEGGNLFTPDRLVVFNPDSSLLRNNSFLPPTETCNVGIGRCSVTTTRTCVTDADCLLAHQVCPPGVTPTVATDCFLEIPIPIDFQAAANVAVNPNDGTVWFNHYVTAFAPDFVIGTESVYRYEPGSGQFMRLPLGRPPQNLPFPQNRAFPADVRISSRGDVVVTEQMGNRLLFIDQRTPIDASCQALTSPNPGDICDLSNPEPACHNPCTFEVFIPGGFGPCTPRSRSDPNCPWNSVTTLSEATFYAWIDGTDKVWFGQSSRVGYILVSDLVAGRSNVVMMPPATLYPPSLSFCDFGSGPVTVSLGGITVDRSTSPRTIWYTDFCGGRLGRHRKLP